MCNQQRPKPASTCSKSDQSLCKSLEYFMNIKLVTEHHLKFLCLTGGCTGLSESALVKMPYSTPCKLCLWWVYCFHVVCPSVRACVRPSVTFCFLNNSKIHCWIFIKPCKHVRICKTNTLDKKVRARGQFY